MDDGLIQFLVIGFFIIISIMEGATRKKRQRGQALDRPAEAEVEFLRSPTGHDQAEPEEDEGLVPGEIWGEIAELARGGARPALERPEIVAVTPYEPASILSAAASEEAVEAAEAAETAAFHRVHSVGLADRKKDVHYAQSAGRSSTMRRFFGKRGGRAGELRRAIILSEILGPPVSLREEQDW